LSFFLEHPAINNITKKNKNICGASFFNLYINVCIKQKIITDIVQQQK